MDEYGKEFAEVLRRVSLISLKKERESKKSLESKENQLKQEAEVPNDSFYLTYVVLLLIGLLGILPGSFFITANKYWMYKFRDVTKPENSTDRTPLQTFYGSYMTMTSSITGVIMSIISTFFGHKIKARPRLLITTFFALINFCIFTAFIKIDTDSWQLIFFGTTVAVLVLINASMSLFITSSMVVLSKFPQKYANAYLIGESVTGIISAILQIISLSISPSPEESALIYFSIGTVVIAITIFFIYISKYLPTFQYYMELSIEDPKRPVFTYKQILSCVKLIWPCLVISFFTLGSIVPIINISNLVVSENFGNGELWNDTYFVPFCTYFLSSIFGLLGRLLSKKCVMKKSNAKYWVVIACLWVIVHVAVMFLCNAYPRSHLPVVFKHDWEYIAIKIFFGFTSGLFFNIQFLSIQVLAEGQEEIAYLTLMTFMSIIYAASSPLGLLSVKLL